MSKGRARELADLVRTINVRACGEPGFEGYEIAVSQIEHKLRRVLAFLTALADREDSGADGGLAPLPHLRRAVRAVGG
jgi:hypothetical protein